MNRLDALLGAQRPVLLDHGMGTLLQDAGLEDGAPGELWNVENRELVEVWLEDLDLEGKVAPSTPRAGATYVNW